MASRKLVSLAAVLLSAVFLGSGVSIARAQDNSATYSGPQSDSLGDAARKARAQKKEPPKPAKVFTNDDVGDLKGTISVIGNEPAAPATAGKSANGAAATTDKASAKTDDKKTDAKIDAKADAKKEGAKDEGYWRARFAAARKILADDTKELDVLQREYNLKLQQYSQDPNWAMHEQYSRDDINKTQTQIEAKKQDVDKDKQALSDLQDELRKSGGEPGWASEPSGGSGN